MGSLHEVLCGVAVAAGALRENVCDAVRFHTPEIQRWVRNHTLLVSILVTSGLGAGVPLVLVASSVSPSANNIKTDELVLGASLRDIQVQIDRALGETLSQSSLPSSTSLSSTSSSSPLPYGLAVGKR